MPFGRTSGEKRAGEKNAERADLAGAADECSKAIKSMADLGAGESEMEYGHGSAGNAGEGGQGMAERFGEARGRRGVGGKDDLSGGEGLLGGDHQEVIA